MITIATLGGILPALLWLHFWLKEDKRRPEPKRLIARTFLVGALAILPAYLLEKTLGNQAIFDLPKQLTAVVLIWAIIEEGLKFLVVAGAVFWDRNYDEPIDAMIYLLTGALGFAAAENTMFILSALNQPNAAPLAFLLTGNFRFIGATIVHIVSSTILGGFIALAYYRHRLVKLGYFAVGLGAAVSLHALFNYLIILGESTSILKVFAWLWLVAVMTLLFFERVKRGVRHLRN